MPTIEPTTQKDIQTAFLSYLGNFIKRKRRQKNISQHVLCEYLGIDRTTLSKCENGHLDIPVSRLPLISHYCGFSLSEYFSLQNAQVFLDTFHELIKITEKVPAHGYAFSNNILIGYIYQDGETEYIKKVPLKRQRQKKPKIFSSIDIDTVQPFTIDEMKEYFMLEKNEDKRLLLEATRIILGYSQKQAARTMEKNLAQFVLKNCFMEFDTMQKKRLLAYYHYYIRTHLHNMNEDS